MFCVLINPLYLCHQTHEGLPTFIGKDGFYEVSIANYLINKKLGKGNKLNDNPFSDMNT